MRRSTGIVSLVFGAVLVVAGGCSGDADNQGASGGNNTAATAGAGAQHRIEHNTGLTYEGGGQHERITDPAPHVDFPGVDKLKCSTSGAPVASGVITNTTTSTNDYHLAVYFYSSDDAHLGAELARTFAQVYMVAPGETLQYSTAEPFGESHVLNGGTICRAQLLERAVSGPDSNPAPAPENATCGLLTTDEVAKVAGTQIKANGSRNPGNCSWEDANDTFYLLIAKDPSVAAFDFQATYPSPCGSGPYGFAEGNLKGTCQKGAALYFYTYSNSSADPQKPPAQSMVDGISSLIALAMSRAS